MKFPMRLSRVLTVALISLVAGILLSFPNLLHAAAITDYRPVSIPCRDARGALQLAIRSCLCDGIPHYLLVNPATLATTLEPVTATGPAPADAAQKLAASLLAALLQRTAAPPVSLQNHGITHATRPGAGKILTVDLCPSRRPMETGMFRALTDLARASGKPTPVAIAITGAWLASHPEELGWLKEQERRGLLAITWVNHSLTHRYDPAVPLAQNFLLMPGTDQQQEVLANEVKMLEQGLVPSPFFRFPGLVGDEKLVALLRRLSLIPLGADAWLAKGEIPYPGSIILVHGNGNEPPGISRLMPLITGTHPVSLIPLAEALTGPHQRPVELPAKPASLPAEPTPAPPLVQKNP